MKNFAILLLTAFVLPATNSAGTVECSRCISDAGCFASHYRLATAVFSGKAVAAGYRKTKVDYPGESQEVEVLAVTFEVESWWKGGETSEVDIYTADWRLPDGSRRVMEEHPDFKIGERYLVYAYAGAQAGQLRTAQCSRGGALSGEWKSKTAEEDMRRLGEGKPPTKR